MKRIFSLLLLCLTACHAPKTLESGSWDPHVRESLNALLASAQPGGYAVFDFDKTSIVHDVSQALWVYQIEHLAFADAPAHAFIDGIPDPSREMAPGVSFAQMGASLEAEYEILVQRLGAGMSLEQVRESEPYLDFRARMFSLEAREVIHGAILEHLGKDKLAVEEWRSPDGRWGGAVERGIYFSPEMKDLFACLKDNGITPYVCSASLELIVEGLACDPDLGPGLPPEQVFGLRFIPSEPIAAVYDSTYVQPIGPGKVSCIKTHMAPLHGGRGPILVAGDSNGDVPMLTAFEDMRCGLIIDVGRSLTSPIGELAALARSGGARYLLQPAFAKADGAVEGGGI